MTGGIYKKTKLKSKKSDLNTNYIQFKCPGVAASPGSTRHNPVAKAQRMVSEASRL